ncbi:MAG: RNA polymerase sigma factor [Flavisolibacter sp.]
MQQDDIAKQFELLVRNNEMLLRKVCGMYADTRSNREDLFQDIVMQLWKAFPRFRGDSKASTWLYRVAINTSINGLRKKKDFIHSYEPEALPANIADTDADAAEEQLQKLYRAIGQLNEIERAIVMLYLEERSYEEMEEILGISSGTLRVKMNRIKEKLRHITKINLYGT